MRLYYYYHNFSAEKYCRLLEREGGRAVLEKVIKDPRPDSDTQKLAQRTIRQLDNKARCAGRSSSDESCDEFEAHEEVEEGEEQEGMDVEEEEFQDAQGDQQPPQAEEEGAAEMEFQQ